MRTEPPDNTEPRASITPEERAAIDKWLSRNKVKRCKPCTFTEEHVHPKGWRQQNKAHFRVLNRQRKFVKRPQNMKDPEVAKRRDRVLAMVMEGMSNPEIAAEVGVTKWVVGRDIKELRKEGRMSERPSKAMLEAMGG